MRQNFIRRYKAISNYYTRIKHWQKESADQLGAIQYNSPDFVINVVKERPLLNYLSKNKTTFLKNLPTLSAVFHEHYNPTKNNVDDVYNDLHIRYLKNISENSTDILKISIVDYIQNTTEYAYLETAPLLQNTIRNIQKVSTPFCNVTHRSNPSDIQNYVIHEKITSNADIKLSEFVKHRYAAIMPILTFRSDNKKKYVAIQVAAIENVEDIARFD